MGRRGTRAVMWRRGRHDTGEGEGEEEKQERRE